MENVTCWLCNSESDKTFIKHKLDKQETFVRRCKNCKLRFQYPQPNDQNLAKEYEKYFKKRNNFGKRLRTNFFEKLLLEVNLSFDNKKILEIGSGEGDCILAINRLWPSATVTAIESLPEVANLYKELNATLFQMCIEDWLNQNHKNKFDAVIAFDLLEHLRNPLDVLKKITVSNLNEEAYFIASFPNADSLTRKVLMRLWPQYKVEHLNYFSKKSIDLIADNVNLETVKLIPLKKTLPIEYLLNVGNNFGPPIIRKIISIISSCIPRILKKKSLTIYIGEWLWISKKLN